MPKHENSRGWNEFNTFSKLIYPYLEESLGYPPRKSEHFDEQTWVRKRGEKVGPYDGAFKDDRGVLVLVEAKKQGKELGRSDIEQAFDYCLGDTFTVPPPYVLVSNGEENKWFRRVRSTLRIFSYVPCDEIKWRKAKKESGAGELTEQLGIKELVRLLSRLRKIIYRDLVESYFPRQFSLKVNQLGSRRKGFEEVLKTRKNFVDATLEDVEESKAIQFVLSSIALSITLKVLFIKITTDRKSNIFPKELKKEIKKLSKSYPGILIAKPYDVLEFSKTCEDLIVRMLKPVSILQGLIFETTDNPIGDIWDGLVESEEHDLQVESLGNVYTPDPIVKAMVNSAEKALKGWRNISVLEPSCGSGHFVREVYKRLRDEYLSSETGARVSLVNAHKQAMAHLRAVDIDPFAVQTTQLGMFLELYRTQDVWKKLAPKGRFDFSQVVDRGDFLDTGFRGKFQNYAPDLVIGNPPYGIKVSDEIVSQFELGSNDSYGCFLAKALSQLSPGGYLSFILSSTFLTAKTHSELRGKIYQSSSIKKVLTLHRNAFAGRDVFPAILEVEKITSRQARSGDRYIYSDAWPVIPTTDEYLKILESWSSGEKCDLPESKFKTYDVPISIASIRKFPPSTREVDQFLEMRQRSFIPYNYQLQGQSVYPIFAGFPSIFLFCADEVLKGKINDVNCNFLGFPIRCLEVVKNGSSVSVAKLWQFAQVRQGLATADDERFLRKTPGVTANARRRNIKDVDLKNTVSMDQLSSLTEQEKKVGIDVVDYGTERFFVPYDKGGEQDPAAGNLRAFWSPVDYWIDWSKAAVDTLNERNSWRPGTPKKPRLQNKDYYFTKGIRFTRAGLYAPMFELSFGGVFSDKGSLIIPIREEMTNYLLAVLCSPLTRYVAKNFLQNSVMTEVDIIRQIPIAIPNELEFSEVNSLVDSIIEMKKSALDSKPVESKLWEKIYDIYKLTSQEREEINTWFKRRYPNFGRSLS